MSLRQRVPEPAKAVFRQIKQAVRKPCERAADLADGFLRHMGWRCIAAGRTIIIARGCTAQSA